MRNAIHRGRGHAAAAAALGAVAFLGIGGAGTAGAAASSRATIRNTQPAWAIKAHRSGAPLTQQTVDLRVYLASPDPAGLAAYATAVSTPSNAAYGHFLSASQAQARFGPTSQEASAVESWLQSAGLTVASVNTQIGGYVEVTGSIAAAEKAFGVTFAEYTSPGDVAARAPEQAASAPNSVAADVLAVSGLDTATHEMKPYDSLPKPPQNYWVAPPTSSYYGQRIATNEPQANGVYQPWTNAGYTPEQIRGAYGVTASGMTGHGVTVAVVDAYASPTMLQDANQYAEYTGDQPFAPGQYQQFLSKKWTQTKATQCGAQGWYGEESLDVESVHGEAPDANVDYVGAESCTDPDLLAALAYIDNNDLANIVTDSWGEPMDQSTTQAAYDEVFQVGATEGIGFFFSSGDSGYEDPAVEDPGSDQIQVDYPASSPWVTSVGGTSLAIGPSDNYEWETAWGTLLDPLASSGTAWENPLPPAYSSGTYDGSSGGGVSTVYSQPSYQQGVVPTTLAESLPNGTTSSTPMRVEPDVAALADPSTGFLVGETTENPSGHGYAFALSRIGGTSVASPTFAGIEADAQQAAGHSLGFANPAIYARYGTDAFNTVTDDPLGPGVTPYEVRNNYTDPYTKQGPLVTYLRAMGIDGAGAAALTANGGYSDAVGVGSPDQYIQSFG
jgi:subtilase family serine protease